MTAAYTELDSNKPSGASTPTQFAADALANIRALRDIALAGRAKGFVQSQSGGADAAHPQFKNWINATLNIGFRLNMTWGGTGGHQISSCQWEWTDDGGATWAVMGSAQANTYDGSNNITSTTNSGGWITLFFEVWTKCLKVVADLASHIAATGTAVHGLGSVSTQSAGAVALTGGNADNVILGATTPADGDFTRVREKFHDYGAIAAAGTVTMEWDKYAHVAFTPNAVTTSTITLAFSGVPASGKSQSLLVEIINGQRSADGKFTYPTFGSNHYIGSRPLDTAFKLAGHDFFVVTTRDGGANFEWNYVGGR